MTARKTKVKVILPRKFQLEALADAAIQMRLTLQNIVRTVSVVDLSPLNANDQTLLKVLAEDASRVLEQYD